MKAATTGVPDGGRASRLFLEAVVVVGSILLAFSIDAWWDGRADREAEVVLLQRLHADFIELQAALQSVANEHHISSEASLALLGFPADQPLPNTREVDTMVGMVFIASRTFNPGSGAVASFLNSDGARLITNQRLADQLLAWPGLVEELQEEEANLQKGVAERWTPFLAARVNLGPYIDSFEILAGQLPTHVSMPTQRAPLLADTEFRNHVLNRYTWQQLAIRDIEPLQKSVDEILAILGSELNR